VTPRGVTDSQAVVVFEEDFQGRRRGIGHVPFVSTAVVKIRGDRGNGSARLGPRGVSQMSKVRGGNRIRRVRWRGALVAVGYPAGASFYAQRLVGRERFEPLVLEAVP
jgi:hypothetical protein